VRLTAAAAAALQHRLLYMQAEFARLDAFCLMAAQQL
jgi:hypothetical protein